MIKLSQRAWNNVIIVSMLTLIMLFNLSNNFLNDEDDDPKTLSRLLPENLLISTIEFENAKIERVGQGWRVESDLSTTKNLQELINFWQLAEVILFEQTFQWEESQPVVTVWFIGQSEPLEYQFVTLADKTLVKMAQQTYQLVDVSYQMLSPTE